MRSSSTLASSLVTLSLFAVGCGSNGLGTGGSADLTTPAPPDLTAPADLTVPPDLAMSLPPPPDLLEAPTSDASGIVCGGGKVCGKGQKCCVAVQGMMASSMCMDSCADGAFSVACEGPGDCGGNPCCISIVGGGIQGGAMCTNMRNACSPAIDLQTRGGMDRLCHIDGDCTNGAPNTMLNKCCTVMQGGNKAHICLNDLFAQFAGGTCP